MVASLVLSFNPSGWLPVELDNQQAAFLAAPKNDEVLQLMQEPEKLRGVI